MRNFNDEIVQNSVHGNIHPADVRDGDLLQAVVRSLDPQYKYEKELKIWKMSPLGVELLVQNPQELPKGSFIELVIRVGLQETVFQGLSVDHLSDYKNAHIVHIRLLQQKDVRTTETERRKSVRWICSEQFNPTAVATNPVKYNDFIYFRVKDISSDGFKLYTSLRNKFIVPGMFFDCMVNFPMVAQLNLKFQVKNVRVETEGEKEVLAVGVTFDKSKKQTSEIIGQYLFQFSNVNSLSELKQAGFAIETVSDAVQFSYVKSKEDYEKVLKLRYKAYRAAQKISEDKTYQDMADTFDSRSRIVIGKYKGEIVSTGRLIFHQYEDKLEQENYITWPDHLPRRDEIVEITRVCTDPDFRGSDLLLSMFNYFTVTVAQSKRQWVVLCASNEMKSFYQKIGFEKTGLSYPHKALNNLEHHVLIGNFVETLTGESVGPIYWNIVWSEAAQYLSQYDYLQMNPISQIRMSIYKLLAPIAQIVLKLKRKNNQRSS